MSDLDTVPKSGERYLANAAVIDGLIAAASSSAFADGRTLTFTKAAALGLDKRGVADGVAGWTCLLKSKSRQSRAKILALRELSLE